MIKEKSKTYCIRSEENISESKVEFSLKLLSILLNTLLTNNLIFNFLKKRKILFQNYIILVCIKQGVGPFGTFDKIVQNFLKIKKEEFLTFK